jgi:hypothetical protein
VVLPSHFALWLILGGSFYLILKKNLHLRFESCKVNSKCLVLKSQLCKKKKRYGTKVWIWWKCWNFVKLSRTVDRHNKCAAANPPFFSSQEVSRSSEIGERAIVRSCVVLRPFCSLLLVRSAGAQPVAAAWREFLAWNWEDCCYSGGTELGRFGKGKKCSGCVFVGWGNRGPGWGSLDLFWCCSVLFYVLVFFLYRRDKRKRAEDCCSLTDRQSCSVIRKELGSTPKRQGHEQEQEEISLVARRNERWEEASGMRAAGKQAFKELVCVRTCVTYRVFVKEEGEGSNMGGGNGQKSKTARERNAEKAAKQAGKGSQLDTNKKAMTIQCKSCMQTFMCTTSEVKCKEHAEAKHPKVDLGICFPHLLKK